MPRNRGVKSFRLQERFVATDARRVWRHGHPHAVGEAES